MGKYLEEFLKIQSPSINLSTGHPDTSYEPQEVAKALVMHLEMKYLAKPCWIANYLQIAKLHVNSYFLVM